MKAKIAYCISGEPRFVRECAPNHLLLIDQLSETFDVDIYCHSWLQTTIIDKPMKKNNISRTFNKLNYHDTENMISKTFNPFYHNICHWEDYKSRVWIDDNSPLKIHQQVIAHGIIADEIYKSNHSYDIIIKTRYDLLFNHMQVNLPSYLYHFIQPNEPHAPNDMVVEHMAIRGFPWIQDKFIIGKKSFADEYTLDNLARCQRILIENDIFLSMTSENELSSRRHLASNTAWTIPMVFSKLAKKPRIVEIPRKWNNYVFLYRQWHKNAEFDVVNIDANEWKKIEDEAI